MDLPDRTAGRTISKRTALGLISATAATPAATAGGSGPTGGPRVFGDYDQAGLDAQFNQALHAANLEQVTGRWRSNSDEARARLGEPQRTAYGASGAEHLDLYLTHAKHAPILIFIHGGEWRMGAARASAYAAETFVHAGAHFIAPDFIDVVQAEGSLDAMVAQLRSAVAWVYRHAASFGGDRNRIHLAGHSSGAHLAAVLLETDWPTAMGLPADVIKSGLCCSGLYDLEPVSLSARRAFVKFTPDVVERLSPRRHPEAVRCPVVLAYAALDSAEFQRQTTDFAASLKSAGRDVRVVRGAGYNHFELIETLASPYGVVGRAALQLMRLG